MYILYGGDFTRAGFVQWVLEVGGLPHQVRKIDILKGEHRTKPFWPSTRRVLFPSSSRRKANVCMRPLP